MTVTEARICRMGAVAFVLAGALFLAANVPTVTLAHPPVDDAGFARWASDNRARLMAHNELLFFATGLLVPASLGLHQLLRHRPSVTATFGLGLLVLNIPVLSMLIIAEGRLIYPVYDLDLSAESQKLAFSVFQGGFHAVLLILGAAVILIGWGARSAAPRGRLYWYASVATAVLQLAGAYPWLTPAAFNLIVVLSFSGWLALTGVWILWRESEPGPASRTG